MTDQELQLALVKMLPDKLYIYNNWPCWLFEKNREEGRHYFVGETEWLHVCWLIEQELTEGQAIGYVASIHVNNNDYEHRNYPVGWPSIHASWQQRAQALIKVKGTQ